MYLTLVSHVNESYACYPFPFFPVPRLSLLLIAIVGYTYWSISSECQSEMSKTYEL